MICLILQIWGLMLHPSKFCCRNTSSCDSQTFHFQLEWNLLFEDSEYEPILILRLINVLELLGLVF